MLEQHEQCYKFVGIYLQVISYENRFGANAYYITDLI